MSLYELYLSGKLSDSGGGSGGGAELLRGVIENSAYAEELIIPDGTVKIGEYKFRNDTALKKVVIPDSVKTIEMNAFYGCNEITEINIPNNIISVGVNAFNHCPKVGIVNLSVPSTLVNIGDSAFKGSNFVSVDISEGVTTIGDNAFDSGGLRSANLPSTITSIGKSAFSYNSFLASVTILATNPPTMGKNVFNSVAAGLVVYVPEESVDAYKAADGWSNYADKITPIP